MLVSSPTTVQVAQEERDGHVLPEPVSRRVTGLAEEVGSHCGRRELGVAGAALRQDLRRGAVWRDPRFVPPDHSRALVLPAPELCANPTSQAG